MKKQLLVLMIILSGISLKGFSQTTSFTMDNSQGCAPLCTAYYDQSSNVVSWTWDFGDGGPVSNVQYPFHCYSAPGTYTVTETVTFSNSTTGTATGTVTVYPPPTANFTFVYNGNNTVTFTNQSTGGATSYYWNFGDSQYSTTQNSAHTYAASGNYNVTLTVTTAMSCSDSTVILVSPSGIHELNSSINWNIFPNPSNGQMTIHFDSNQQQEMIRVENTLGELILQKEIASDATIDLSTCSAGIYFVRIGNSPAKKFVIE